MVIVVCFSVHNTFFLLAAAWEYPGRSALQSAEQRCQRRYGRKHQMMLYIKNVIQKHATRPQRFNKPSTKTVGRDQMAESVQKRAPVKSPRKAPTPEWEDAIDTYVKNEGFGETQKEAPTPEPSVRNVPRKV